MPRRRVRYVYLLCESIPWETDNVLSTWSSFRKAEREKNRLYSVVNGGYGHLTIRTEVVQ
jgi:hypothetical protein